MEEIYYKSLNACPVCFSEKIKFLTKGFGDDIRLHQKLNLKFIKSKWFSCNNCDHLFLNPTFSSEINLNFYGHDSIYRKFSMLDKSLESYLNSIDPNIPKIESQIGQRRNFYKIAEQYLDNKTSSSVRFLDFGAGFGTSEAYIKRDNVSYIGVEIDEWCLDIAKKYKRNVLHPSNLDFKEFDIVYSWQVFEHIENPHEGITQALNYLRNNGIMAINIPTHEFSFKKNWSFAGLKTLNWSHFHSYTENSMKKLFSMNNIESLEFYLDGGDIFCIGKKNEQKVNINYSQKNVKNNHSFIIQKNKLNLHIFLGICILPFSFIKKKLKKIRFFRRLNNIFRLILNKDKS